MSSVLPTAGINADLKRVLSVHGQEESHPEPFYPHAVVAGSAVFGTTTSITSIVLPHGQTVNSVYDIPIVSPLATAGVGVTSLAPAIPGAVATNTIVVNANTISTAAFTVSYVVYRVRQ
jgi:hypothetical protein